MSVDVNRLPFIVHSRSIAFTALFLMAACSNESSPPNRPPEFISANSVSVTENVAGFVYQANATDPDGNPVTYAISGGADSSRFTISSLGQVSFVTSPNFDLPQDANADNVYDIEITASDGELSATRSIQVIVTNSLEGISVRRVANGFVEPTAIWPIDRENILVAEKSGTVYSLNIITNQRSVIREIRNVSSVGVLAVAADPNYRSNQLFSALYGNGSGIILNRFRANSEDIDDFGVFSLIFGAGAPNYEGGGWLGYDVTGALLAATGDAGGVGDPTGSAQNDQSLLGKLIRITANPDPFAGASPRPFIVTIIGKGLHQPIGGRANSNAFFLGDRGQNLSEELNFVVVSGANQNFGWPFLEGLETVRSPTASSLVPPFVRYPRTAGRQAGLGIVAGALGPDSIPSLVGRYLFADITGAIFTIDSTLPGTGVTKAASSIERRDADFIPDRGLITRPVAINSDDAGNIYILDGDGEIFAVEPA